MRKQTIVEKIENFINKYCTFPDSSYSLPVALWILATYMFIDFDAFPYLVVTSSTKRSGKTRLGIDLMKLVASNPESASGITYASLFQAIKQTKPVLLFDEAEMFSSESADNMRLVLNTGYRKGQTIKRQQGVGNIIDYEVYCPKVFVLIGDVFDTLRDRSIVVRMKRAEPKERFLFEVAKAEGQALREEAAQWIAENRLDIITDYQNFKGISFLHDRDEEIWTPLFVIANRIVPERMTELTRDAVDIATEKTAEKVTYKELKAAEAEATKKEYGEMLLRDLYAVFKHNETRLTTQDALQRLYDLPTGPWRKFRGKGLNPDDMGALLEIHRVEPKPIQIGHGRKDRKVLRGYKREQVEAALKLL